MSASRTRRSNILNARVLSWCFYDWANSAYSAVVLSFVFAPYFLKYVARDDVSGTVQWSFAITGSSIAIGLLSPIVGAFGDKGGRRRRWLFAFSGIAIVATAGMWLVGPEDRFIPLAMLLLAISNLGFELAYVFYNAMLPEVSPPGCTGRVSGLGWGLGYFGALAAMALIWFVLVNPSPPLFGLDNALQEPVRAAAPLAALWFLVFAMPLLFLGPADTSSGLTAGDIVAQGMKELWSTLKSLSTRPSIGWYLLAHMIYIDGVNTLIIFGPLFAAGVFGFTSSESLLYGITIFVAAGLGSFALGWIDDRVGSKPVIAASIAIIAVAVGAMLIVEEAAIFWILSVVIGLLIGPVQSASRSLMARLAPEESRTQLFGLYSLAGRATAPLGPALVGWLVLETGAQRSGAAVICVLMLIGLILMLPVREPRSSSLS